MDPSFIGLKQIITGDWGRGAMSVHGGGVAGSSEERVQWGYQRWGRRRSRGGRNLEEGDNDGLVKSEQEKNQEQRMVKKSKQTQASHQRLKSSRDSQLSDVHKSNLHLASFSNIA